MNSKRTEFIVGTFVLFGLTLSAFLTIQFGRFGDRFKDHYSIETEFSDATGVIKGGEVRMGGAVIGQVAEQPRLKEDASGVIVELSIQDGVKIPAGAKFQVASLNLLGDRYIQIRPPMVRSGEFVEEGAMIVGEEEGGLEAITKKAADVTEQAVKTMKKLDESLEVVDSAVGEIEESAANIRKITAKVDEEILKAGNLENLDETLQNVAEITDDLKRGSERFEPLMVEAELALKDVRGVMGEARTVFAGANEVIEKADERMAELEPTFKELPATFEKFRGALGKASDAIDGIASGNGLLGALSKDQQMKLDAKVFLQNLRRYGILRYRDPSPVEEFPEKPKTRRR